MGAYHHCDAAVGVLWHRAQGQEHHRQFYPLGSRKHRRRCRRVDVSVEERRNKASALERGDTDAHDADGDRGPEFLLVFSLVQQPVATESREREDK